MSRNRQAWGIPFPGDPEQTVYVWFDALINYLSATGYPDPGYERLWPADLHVVGKGITRFHCVIWPAMLLSAGVALPREVWAHGYVQWEGTKMSKSAGTAVSLGEAIERHGPDALRYFLLREVGLRGRRQLHLGPVRRAVHRGPGGRPGQPGVALAGDGGQVPGRRGAVGRRSETALDQAGRQRDRRVRPRDGRAGSPRRRRGGVGAGRDGESVHPAGRRPGRWPRRARRRSWTLRSAALARALYRLAVLASTVHPGQSPTPLAIARARARRRCERRGRPRARRRWRALATNKPEVLFPKPQSV